MKIIGDGVGSAFLIFSANVAKSDLCSNFVLFFSFYLSFYLSFTFLLLSFFLFVFPFFFFFKVLCTVLYFSFAFIFFLFILLYIIFYFKFHVLILYLYIFMRHVMWLSHNIHMMFTQDSWNFWWCIFVCANCTNEMFHGVLLMFT